MYSRFLLKKHSDLYKQGCDRGTKIADQNENIVNLECLENIKKFTRSSLPFSYYPLYLCINNIEVF